MSTSKLALTLTDELIKAVKKKSTRLFGNRRGAISIYVEMTLRNDLHLKQPEVEEA